MKFNFVSRGEKFVERNLNSKLLEINETSPQNWKLFQNMAKIGPKSKIPIIWSFSLKKRDLKQIIVFYKSKFCKMNHCNTHVPYIVHTSHKCKVLNVFMMSQEAPLHYASLHNLKMIVEFLHHVPMCLFFNQWRWCIGLKNSYQSKTTKITSKHNKSNMQW